MDGWDPRPWDERFEGRILESFTRTPAAVGSFLRDATSWVQAHPDMRVEAAPSPPLVLLQSWNELGEGAYVLPTDGDGYSYGQAIAQAVGVPWTPPPKRTLSITPSARGTVTSAPSGIACPTTCAAGFDEGLEINLTAIPEPGFVVDGWTGCTASESSCSLVLMADSTARPVITPVVQRRVLSLRLAGRLVARGRIIVRDGYPACASQKPVLIQRQQGTRCRRIASTRADQSGKYRVTLRNRPGIFRALVPQSSFGKHACLAASSTRVARIR